VHAAFRLPSVDVVHVHGDLAEILAGAALGRVYGAPVVATLHGRLSDRSAAAGRVYRLPDAVIAVSHGVRDQLVARGVRPDRVEVIPSGIADPPAALAWRPGGSRLVSVGLLDPMKGHDVAIEAVRRLRDRGVDVSLSIVGDGPLRADLGAAATGAGLGDHVELTGALTHGEVLRRMSDALALVVASRRLPGKAEGTPTVMLEALALGTPIVATRSAGWETPVDAGAFVTVVPDDDAAAVADAAGAILERPVRYEAVADLNRDVSRRFRWPVAVSRVDAVYERVLKARPHGMREAEPSD
jgi:glycosyltransferase involved in cell wall biosynthesis